MTIPYKTVSAAVNAHTLIEAGVAAKNGAYGDAAVKTLSVVAGKSVAKLVPSGTPGKGVVEGTVGLGASKATEKILGDDCSNCTTYPRK